MIDLVEDAPRLEAPDLDLAGSGIDGGLPGPPYVGGEVGQTEAAFAADLGALRYGRDLGVDEDDQAMRVLGVGVVRDVDDGYSRGDPDLGCREPHAVIERTHRVDEIGYQFVDLALAGRGTDLLEDRVRVGEDCSDCHLVRALVRCTRLTAGPTGLRSRRSPAPRARLPCLHRHRVGREHPRESRRTPEPPAP